MRILHCIGRLEGGGAEEQLRILARNSVGAGHTVGVLCLDDRGRGRYGNQVQVMLVPRGRRWAVLTLGRGIGREMARFHPDLVHLWLPEVVTIPSALCATRLGARVLSAHRRAPSNRVSTVQYIRDRLRFLAHLLADRIVTNFELDASGSPTFNRIAGRKGYVVIPNAVDLDAISSVPRVELGGPSGTRHVVFAGRMMSQKGIDTLVDAIARLVARGHAVQLHLFGVGPMEAEMRHRVARLDLGARVQFHGFDRAWLSSAKSADVFVLPSKSEGMPNVLLEAAAAGIPIVSTTIPEISKVFEHRRSAWLVPYGDVQALEAGLARLLNDEKLRGDLVAGAAEVTSRYTTDRMVTAYLELYDEILEGGA